MSTETKTNDIAARTGLSDSAIAALKEAISRGHGKAAQFNHPDLGGMGQWSGGGMVQIGDMFNKTLAEKVSLACSLLSESVDVRSAASPAHWWPNDLGEPSQSASQNAIDYAYFPDKQRLAVRRQNKVEVYDLVGAGFQGVGAQSGTLVVNTDSGSKPIESFKKLA